MKNKTIKVGLFTVSTVLTVFCVILACYFFTTLSAEECIEYCLENTNRSATNFTRIGDGRYVEDYAYYIAVDGDSSKPQEVFVFKKKFLGFIHFDRYKFVMSSTQSKNNAKDENKFGSIQFFTRNDNGEKETESTLIFFGTQKDSDITEYEYKLTVREGSNIYRGNVSKGESVWFVKFYGLCNTDENYKKLVSEVKFYDSNGDLVGAY